MSLITTPTNSDNSILCPPPPQARARAVLLRATSSQIRRAAGGKDVLAQLQQMVDTGWTVDELNQMASDDSCGKSALHIAAWQGQMETIDYLLQFGCNINSIATGKFCYGKTPIFFAATTSRKDVIEYLLARGAHVKIVNNKGQSVLSIASSHDVGEETIDNIQKAEQQQSHLEWQNYRESHSDGFEYGDLDPRFLERPLRPTDVVTEFAVNPTTKQSRRGNFLRKNPQVAREQIQKPKSRQQRKEKGSPVHSEEIIRDIQDAWTRIFEAIHNDDLRGDANSAGQDLLIILRLGEKLRRPWIQEAAAHLRQYSSKSELIQMVVQFASSSDGTTKREMNLLQKLYHQTCYPTSSAPYKEQQRGEKRIKKPIDFSTYFWDEARREVAEVYANLLENMRSSEQFLSLSQPPIWVDSHDQLAKLTSKLTERDDMVIAIDTEWYTTFDNRAEVATMQIAIVTDNNQIETWVVDLLVEDYIEKLTALIVYLFESCIILVFAFGNDADKLSSFVEQRIKLERCLDLQELVMHEMSNRSTPPSLHHCASHFISKKILLSKDEQCSDWASRPLCQAQLDYAGLDAAVLLVLLAEVQRKSPLNYKA